MRREFLIVHRELRSKITYWRTHIADQMILRIAHDVGIIIIGYFVTQQVAFVVVGKEVAPTISPFFPIDQAYLLGLSVHSHSDHVFVLADI